MRPYKPSPTSYASRLRPGLHIMMWTAQLASCGAGIPLAILAFAGGWLVEYVSARAPARIRNGAASAPYLDESTAAVLG